jgi:hypothetical protein
LSCLGRASRRSRKELSKTLALTSFSLPLGGNWTAATSAYGSTLDKSRNLNAFLFPFSALYQYHELTYYISQDSVVISICHKHWLISPAIVGMR